MVDDTFPAAGCSGSGDCTDATPSAQSDHFASPCIAMSQRKLTVVQAIPFLESGGVERGALEVNQALVQRGHRSIVISGGGRLVQKLIQDGGEHVQWTIGKKNPLALKWVWKMRNFLIDQKVDILHARSRVPAWVSFLAWKSIPARHRPHFVTTAHGLYSVNRYSEVMTYGERVISVSEAVDQYLRTQYPRLDPSRITLIPRGIDPAEFPRGYQPSPEWLEEWYRTFPQLLGQPVISLIGRLTRIKGHSEYIEIVRRLREVVPEVQALIVGGEDPRRKAYAAEIRARIQELGLENCITMVGHRSDIRDIYAVSNVTLSLCAHPPEAFGRSTIEALSIGTPVVGWDSGGTSELLRCIFPQGLVPPGDIDGAVERIAEILQNGAELASDHPYLKQNMLERTLSVYEELAAA